MKTDKPKVLITGYEGSLYAQRIAELAAQRPDIEIVDIRMEGALERQFDKEDEILQEELSYIKPFIINPIPRLQYREENIKPTCSKHHEYVNTTTKGGNQIHSSWNCRHCGKKM